MKLKEPHSTIRPTAHTTPNKPTNTSRNEELKPKRWLDAHLTPCICRGSGWVPTHITHVGQVTKSNPLLRLLGRACRDLSSILYGRPLRRRRRRRRRSRFHRTTSLHRHFQGKENEIESREPKGRILGFFSQNPTIRVLRQETRKEEEGKRQSKCDYVRYGDRWGRDLRETVAVK